MKIIVFGILFIAIHYILGLLFTQAIVLISGVLVLVGAVAASLIIEFRASNKSYGRPLQKK